MEHHIGIGVSRLHTVGVVRPIAADAAHTVQSGLVWAGGRLFISDVAGSRVRVVTPGLVRSEAQ